MICNGCTWLYVTAASNNNNNKLAFVENDDLLILDCLFSHLIWSDVMIIIKSSDKQWSKPTVALAFVTPFVYTANRFLERVKETDQVDFIDLFYKANIRVECSPIIYSK